MELISGTLISNEIKEKMKQRVNDLAAEGARLPKLSVILVGDNPASLSYVAGKERACINVGIINETIRLSGDISQNELEEKIIELNLDPTVDGILVQLPLPKHLDENHALGLVDPQKDVDGLHPMNLGCLVSNREGFIPCTPKGIMAMLDHIGYHDLSGLHVVVIGRSNLVGKPISLLLQQRNATVTMVHSKTKDIQSITTNADLLIVAVGQPKMVDASWVKEGAVVIDVGVNRVDGKLCGDCDFDSVATKASYLTPVPKGVGAMTVCMLLENTLEAYDRHMRGE